jgi:hypothetical protein
MYPTLKMFGSGEKSFLPARLENWFLQIRGM